MILCSRLLFARLGISPACLDSVMADPHGPARSGSRLAAVATVFSTWAPTHGDLETVGLATRFLVREVWCSHCPQEIDWPLDDQGSFLRPDLVQRVPSALEAACGIALCP